MLYTAYRAYKWALKGGSGYSALTRDGVPKIACFVALDREAWRVSQRAIEEFQVKK